MMIIEVMKKQHGCLFWEIETFTFIGNKVSHVLFATSSVVSAQQVQKEHSTGVFAAVGVNDGAIV